jgi:hypothetical protein
MNTPLTININIKECSVNCSLFDRWRLMDTIMNVDVVLKSRTIYGIIGDLGDGGWALSCLLSGRATNAIDESKLTSIKINGESVTHQKFKNIACYIGEGVAEAPYIPRTTYPNKLMREFLGIKTVAQRIQEGINLSESKYSLYEIADMFELTGIDENNEKRGRIHRPLEFQSNEVWRASMAIGFAYGKKLYCCPWMHSDQMSEYIIGEYNRKYIEILKEHNAIVLIPGIQKEKLIKIADEIIYLKDT